MKNPVLTAVASSARFASRRAISPIRAKPAIETLIVDVDRTITAEDSPKLALERLCGKETAKKIFDGFLKSVIRGERRLDNLHLAVFGEIYSRGFRRSDWGALMGELERTGGIRTGMMDSIRRIAEERKLSVVLATRSSQDSAMWLANRFGFEFAIGSVERSGNGSFGGFSTMIGMHDGLMDGTLVLTKVSAASLAMQAEGRRFDPSRTAVISNDLLDALEMLSCARGILFIPNERNTLEKITYGFRLFDTTLREDSDMEKGLRGALGLTGT